MSQNNWEKQTTMKKRLEPVKKRIRKHRHGRQSRHNAITIGKDNIFMFCIYEHMKYFIYIKHTQTHTHKTVMYLFIYLSTMQAPSLHTPAPSTSSSLIQTHIDTNTYAQTYHPWPRKSTEKYPSKDTRIHKELLILLPPQIGIG